MYLPQEKTWIPMAETTETQSKHKAKHSMIERKAEVYFLSVSEELADDQNNHRPVFFTAFLSELFSLRHRIKGTQEVLGFVGIAGGGDRQRKRQRKGVVGV
jgi:hypothetical protein